MKTWKTDIKMNMLMMIGAGHYGEVPLLEVPLENCTDFIIKVSRIE